MPYNNRVMEAVNKQLSGRYGRALILILILCLQIWLCFTMRIQLDEPYYAALGYRFATGTRMFVDEWHISQMFGFLTMPFVWLFMQVTGGTDGVVLFLRFCYLVMSLITWFLFMKKYGKYPNAYADGIMILLFAPLNMMSLSYNTIGILALLQAHCLINTGKLKSFLAGILFSCAVLSTPYLVLLFAGLVIYDIRRWKLLSPEHKSGRISALLGIVLMVLLFCLFVFHDSTLSQVIEGIRQLPARNQNHFNDRNPVLLMGYRFVIGGWESFGPFIFLQFAAMLVAALSKKLQAQKVCNVFGILSVFYFMVRQMLSLDAPSISNLYLPLALAAFPKMLKEKDNVLKALYFLFLLEALFFGYSSNLGLKSFSQALVIADAAVLMTGGDKKMNRAALVLAACTLMLHWNPVVAREGNVLSEGPMKGIRVPASYGQAYDATVSFLKHADALTEADSYYLVTDSSWQHMLLKNHASLNFSTYQDTVSKEEHVALFNENLEQKKPHDFILIFSNSYQNLQIEDFDLSGYDVTPLEDRVYLLVRHDLQ